MKKYSIFMTHTATEDLKGIASYIAIELQEPSIAKKLILTQEVIDFDRFRRRNCLCVEYTY